jgi:hypothetical protein
VSWQNIHLLSLSLLIKLVVMGNDGGSIPRRNELVKEKKKDPKADERVQTIARWFYCALSKASV